jgi:cytochrome c-type biogenesis protein CcsB
MATLAEIEYILLIIATVGYTAAILVYWRYILARRVPQHWWASGLASGALLAHLIWFGIRVYRSGHMPFYNGHEFASSFACGIVLTVLIFERLSQRRDLGAFAMPIALALLAYAWTLPRGVSPLIPIFRSLWLHVHILTATVAYACFATTFAASCLYLLKSRPVSDGAAADNDGTSILALFDRVAYQATIIGFPFMTVCIISGAIWADNVWARYWTWDPKETWSLITWLFFAAYLHTRYKRGWQQRKAAVLAIIGFLTVLMNFIGVEIIYQYQQSTFGMGK